MGSHMDVSTVHELWLAAEEKLDVVAIARQVVAKGFMTGSDTNSYQGRSGPPMSDTLSPHDACANTIKFLCAREGCVFQRADSVAPAQCT